MNITNTNVELLSTSPSMCEQQEGCSYHNGSGFTTKDHDVDTNDSNRAELWKSIFEAC